MALAFFLADNYVWTKLYICPFRDRRSGVCSDTGASLGAAANAPGRLAGLLPPFVFLVNVVFGTIADYFEISTLQIDRSIDRF
jgi:hypothetical protein